ncbi:MAG: VacJ family lipoprotein [Pseudomonadales bacterium]
MKGLFFILMMLGFPALAEQATDPDPWQGLNKKVHEFNEVADRYVMKPVARGYKAVMPKFARTGVQNFFANLGDLNNAANNFLQGKVGDGLIDLVRIGINSTMGLGGLFDPASNVGLARHNEDFGQTFSVWGAPRGPYLVLPFLGPSTLTDAIGRPFDSALDPVRYYHPVDHRNTLFALDQVRGRAQLLSAEQAVFGDKYLFYRDAYLQRRNYLINDGRVKQDFDDGF